MKTIRLLYPDYLSGGLDEYYFGANLLAQILPDNKNLVGDGSGGGKMTIERLFDILKCIEDNSDIVGFTIAEYLPFDEYRLHKMFAGIGLFNG